MKLIRTQKIQITFKARIRKYKTCNNNAKLKIKTLKDQHLNNLKIYKSSWTLCIMISKSYNFQKLIMIHLTEWLLKKLKRSWLSALVK